MAPATADSTPLAPPPAGQHSQFVNPQTHDAPYIAVMVIFIAISTPMIAVRLYTREFITRRVWWDDWTCLLGWAFFIAFIALEVRMLELNATAAMWNISKAEKEKFMEIFKNAEIVARIGIFFTKTSILLLLFRLFVPQGVRFTKSWWGIWMTFWWNLLYAIALILSLELDCVNDKAKKAKGQSCENQFAILIGASVINIITDVIILAIPMLAIRKLQMSRSRKFKWSAAFAVGFLGVLASLARLIFQVIEVKNQSLSVLALVLLLAQAEQFIGILVPCLAAFPAFLRHLRNKRDEDDEEDDKRSTAWTLRGHKGRKRGVRSRSDPYGVLMSTTAADETIELKSQDVKTSKSVMSGTVEFVK